MYIYAFTSFGPLNSYFSIERDQFGGNLFECFVTLTRTNEISKFLFSILCYRI